MKELFLTGATTITKQGSGGNTSTSASSSRSSSSNKGMVEVPSDIIDRLKTFLDPDYKLSTR